MRSNLSGQVRAVTAVRNLINVTPLVDVCLVLLIIFMVVAPMLNKSIAVILPETAKPRSMPELERSSRSRSGATATSSSIGDGCRGSAWRRPSRRVTTERRTGPWSSTETGA